MLELKRKMASELADAFFRDWRDKPFTRDHLSGSQYFEGKHVSVLHEALRLPAGMKEQG